MITYVCFCCKKEFKPKNKPSNLLRPFCSQSCAAKINGRDYIKRLKENKNCLFCSSILEKNINSFCNEECCLSYREEKYIKEWQNNSLSKVNLRSNSYIRNYLYKKQNNKCLICNINNVWNNKKLIFILDHIDGNYLNNTENNLRLICSNCDSQLDTYKAKNKGRGRSYRRKDCALAS